MEEHFDQFIGYNVFGDMTGRRGLICEIYYCWSGNCIVYLSCLDGAFV